MKFNPRHLKQLFSIAKSAFSAFCLIIFSAISYPTLAQDGKETENAKSGELHPEEVNISDVVIEHVLDNHIWHFFDGHYGTLYLPVIVYTEAQGLILFSSRNFFDEHHHPVEYKEYKLEHNKIYFRGVPVFDLSITKNVVMLFINSTLLLIMLTSVARAYKRNSGKAPKGLQSFIEPIVLFVRDEIVKPNVGPKYERYLPYLLTLFFFVLFGNILGLLPGSGNLTGNIAVTMTLAVFTFIITNVSANGNYWMHILWTPGVPLVLRPLILLVEVVGVFTKPFSLMIRLFAAITAGHIVLLSLISLTFIYSSYMVGVGSSLFVIAISLIELLVAGIQAYVFTLFTSLYIGMAVEEHGHDH